MKSVSKTGVSGLLLSLFLMAQAQASHEIGNGGGAWVCRENTNSAIRWAALVDLFEAENEFGLKIATYPGRYTKIVDAVRARFFEANPVLYEAILDSLGKVNYLANDPPQVFYTADELQVIDDALYRLKPGAKRCPGGAINYGQVVNYKDDGRILVQSDLFVGKNSSGTPNLSELEKAALVYHEAIYAYRRENAGDKNSVATRRIVGLLFSTLSTKELRKALEDLGLAPPPPAPVPAPPEAIPITEMRFVRIPAGTFTMGSPSYEYGRGSDEDQHEVTLTRAFEMQTTHVTQAQWVQVMGNNPSKFATRAYCPKTFTIQKGIAMCPNHPVERVSWNDVQEFLTGINLDRQDGYLYRLPTEAEWEYAARAGTTTAYYFGNRGLYHQGWSKFNSEGHTHEVAQFPANPWGLYDMAGNVWQWVSDFLSEYPSVSVKDPKGPSSGYAHMVRGGSWDDDDEDARSASRGCADSPDRSSYNGFRLVRSR